MNERGDLEPVEATGRARPRSANGLTIRQLQVRGLSTAEAGNIAAYLAGIRPSASPWTLPQIERLMFARWLVEAGRLLS